MPSVSESIGQQSALESALRQGLDAIDLGQKIAFKQYSRYVLPLDGYVFWIATGQTVCVDGSFHYAIEEQQDETETVSLNRIVFTSEQEIQEFNAVAPGFIWIGTLGDAADIAGDPIAGLSDLTPFPVRFAFSRRKNFFKRAELYHYVGTAILPAMANQIIDSIADLPSGPIVSNSLPIWLAQTGFGPVYPSFLVPNNETPPYVVAHIEPEHTEPVQQFPTYTAGAAVPSFPPPGQIGLFQIGVSQIGVPGSVPFYEQSSTQLMSDRVRLTLVGFNNQTALQFYNSLLEYSLNTDVFGFQNSPSVRDEKRTQVEVSILQQRKYIDIVASYFLSAANVIAWRLILQATAQLTSPI